MLIEKILEERDLVVFDLETTGTNTQRDRIVQFAGIRSHCDGRPRKRLAGLINPTIPIPPGATKVHGITDEMVEAAPTFAQMALTIGRFMENADLGGYNLINYDIPLLREEYRRCGSPFEISGRRIVDGLRIFQSYERRDLSSALRFYCGEEHLDAHGALGDVRATIKVLQAQLQKYEAHREAPLPTDVEGLSALCLGNRLTLDGKIVWGDDGACLSFGKHAGTPLKEMVEKQRGYLEWILTSEFADDVKTVIDDALAGRYPTKEKGS